MTPEQIEQERLKFEAWYQAFFPIILNKHRGFYLNKEAQSRWEEWLARAEQDNTAA
jgi:hypothetical protein